MIKGIAELPAEDRRCLELYLFQEFTQQEIATEVSSPLETPPGPIPGKIQFPISKACVCRAG
ncbi:hypothetical protein EBZ70_02245 [bacterium]|nr:hypothetical protein [bacterium]